METIENKPFERRKGDGLSIRDAVAFGSNAHWDQFLKHEHVRHTYFQQPKGIRPGLLCRGGGDK